MTPALVGFLGVIVGGVLTHVGNYWFWRRQQEYEARQVARGLQGEIRGILRLLELRDYASALRNHARLTRQTGRMIPFSVSVTREFFRVYHANVERLGALSGSLPEDVARLYALGEGILENFATFQALDPEAQLEEFGISTNEEARRRAVEAWASHLEDAASLVDETIEQGEEVVRAIDEAYPDEPLRSPIDQIIGRFR